MGIHMEINSLHLKQCISNVSHFTTHTVASVEKSIIAPSLCNNTAVCANSFSKNKHKQGKKIKTKR